MILSFLVFLPLLFALIVWFMPKGKNIRTMALVLSFGQFIISLFLLKGFDTSVASLQFVEKVSWIDSIGVTYFLGVDGISIWLVLLSTFLMPLTILGSWTAIKNNVRGFHVCLFLMQTSMLGTFLAMDAVLFYIFFEASLIPMYFMIGIWGGTNRIYASLKFFIYTMLGSVLMLASIIYMIHLTTDQTGTSASLLDFYSLQIPFVAGTFISSQTLLFFAFAIAFAIKVPIFPFHTWLPDAHTEAPTPGSVILAGVMLKMGTYGFIRFCIPMFPQAAEYYSWVFMFLAVIGIIYGALVAMVQPDIKKLVAYSSVSHMGYIMLGIFAINTQGITGGIFQMLSHGISTGALFLLVGMIYEKTHSREISKYGGLAKAAPIFAIFFVIVTMSSIAVPMTNGFVGEFLILMGAYAAGETYVYFAVTGVVLAAAYMLWMVKKVFFGKESKFVKEQKAQSFGLDLNYREILVLIPLVILIFWMGIFPNHFIKYTESSVDHLLKNKYHYYLKVSNN